MLPTLARSGLLYAFLAAFLTVAADASLKFIGPLPLWQIVFTGVFAGQICVLLPLLARNRFRDLRTCHWRWHLVRAALGLVAVFAGIYAIRALPLPLFYSLCFTSPLVKTLLAALWLRERLTWRTLGLLLLGFAGVMLIIRPDRIGTMPDSYALGIAAALALVAVYAVSVLVIRKHLQDEPPLVLSFYPYLADLLVSGTLLLALGGMVPSQHDLVVNAGAGIVAMLANLTLVSAYKYATVARVAPVQYTELLWGTAISWLFWHYLPEASTFAGAALVIACGWLVSRERHGL